MYDNITNEEFKKQINANAYFNSEFIELENAAIFHIWGERNINWKRFGIYSKTKKETFCCNATLYNPFFYYFDSAPIARYGDDICVVERRADIVLAWKSELYRLGKKEVIDEFFEGLTEDSNHVLFFYRIKI